MAELQETGKRLRGIRGAKMEIDKWFQNCGPVADTSEKEAPRTLVTHKGRTPLQPPPSSITTKTQYEALTAINTHEHSLQGETVPAAHSGHRKKNTKCLWWVSEVPICRPDREAHELCCLRGTKV